MFVSPISNFSVSNAYRNNNSQNIKNNQQAPVMQSQLNADTVSFGAKKDKQHNKLNPKTAILAAAIAAAPVACTPDYESYTSLENNTTINLKNYHSCPLDSFPIIIFPPGCDCNPDRPGDDGNGGGCDCDKDSTDCDCNIDCKPDTIWMKDTIYIDNTKPPYFEMNDSIGDDIDDFEIPTEGEGDFFYRFVAENEYLSAEHNILVNGFFSSKKKSSFIDRVIDKEDPKNPKIAYYRIDYSASPATGSRVVQLYTPANGIYNLPNDKETGEAGWRYAGQFIVKKGYSDRQVLQLAVKNIDNNLTFRYYKNENRDPGNMYKEWELDNGETNKTTIKDIKAYKMDISNLQ